MFVAVVNPALPSFLNHRNRTTCAASSPMTSSPLCCSSRSDAAIRWSTWGCWRTSECAEPASPTDRRTLASCKGTQRHLHITVWTSCPSPSLLFIFKWINCGLNLRLQFDLICYYQHITGNRETTFSALDV